ncbi:hypothetical protein HYT01_00205 [Candidatus Giovannonibacteria bacterium]|nr:hypothetical protein [Candidatus Giovannonibacteria bacterium]
MKKILGVIFFALFCSSILILTIRGIDGNPDESALSSPGWASDGPFETSSERGRFALLYSYVEDGSLQFSPALARFALPDLALSPDGKYVSLFAPGVSFIAVPGYFAGKYFGAAQLGVYAVVALFALLNILLVRAIALNLGAEQYAAGLAALAFGFASPAFSYAVAFYQHHISTFFILASIYALTRLSAVPAVLLVAFLYSLAFAVDSPNAILMLPVVIFALGKIVSLERVGGFLRLNFNLLGLITLFVALPALIFLFWFNQNSHGDALKLSGTLERILEIHDDSISLEKESVQKTAVGMFKTRNLLKGFYVHLLSPDRGIIHYAPVLILGLMGFLFFGTENSGRSLSVSLGLKIRNVFLGVIGLNVLLYSMFGDPWGGWAFGSRYLIPSYSILSVGLGVALYRLKFNPLFLLIFSLLFFSSLRINALGALTSNLNPPKAEVLELEARTHIEQKYTYERNFDYLRQKGSKSYFYNKFAKPYMSAERYWYFIAASVSLFALSLLAGLAYSLRGSRKYNFEIPGFPNLWTKLVNLILEGRLT